jgi:hypothetical protein
VEHPPEPKVVAPSPRPYPLPARCRVAIWISGGN